MPPPKEITVTSKIIRHNPQFSRLVTISIDKLEPWKPTGTTTVEGTINETDLGRRSLKKWDERKCWWIDLPEPLCKKARLGTGAEVQLTIRLASQDLPDELKTFSRTMPLRKPTGKNSPNRNNACFAKTSSPPKLRPPAAAGRKRC